jgi:hypothetical protein
VAQAPDFQDLAERAAKAIIDDADVEPLVEALRMIWNARGAADIVKLEAALSSIMGASTAGPYTKVLDRALRTLDR